MTGTTGTPQYPTQQQHTNQQTARPAQRGSTVATVRSRSTAGERHRTAASRDSPSRPGTPRPGTQQHRDAEPQHRDAAAAPHHRGGTPHYRDGYPQRAQPQPQHRC